MNFAIYILVQLAAYALWCTLGVRLFDRDNPRTIAVGIMWGTFRMLMGMVAGLVVYFATRHTMPFHARIAIATFLAIYLPLRIIEWLAMDALVRRGARFTWRNAVWIAGGVAVSFACDLLLRSTFHGMVPVGRPVA
jgi:hypothetical protein